MTATTLPTSRPITQDWNQDFQWLNGRYYPNGFYASIGWKGHNGIDYGCWEGDLVEAVCDGVIEFAGNGDNHWLLSGGGNAILLRNDDLGVRFEYLHLSRFEVRQGQRVTRSQVIARSGNTGISSAPHLHIGAIPVHNVNVNNGYRGRIDPTPYLYGSLNPDYAGSGAVGPQGTAEPAPTETPKEWDEMASKEEIFDAVWGGPGTPMIHNHELGRGEYPRTTLGAMTDRIVRQQLIPLRAEIAGLVGALNKVSGGEPFDEAKLLAGVKAAAEAGVKNAIESIDTTVTIKEG